MVISEVKLLYEALWKDRSASHRLIIGGLWQKNFTEVEGWHVPQCPIAGATTDCLVLTQRLNRNQSIQHHRSHSVMKSRCHWRK